MVVGAIEYIGSRDIEKRKGSSRTCWTQCRVTARDQSPLLSRDGLSQVGNGGKTLGVNGREREGWTPDVKFEGHNAKMLLCSSSNHIKKLPWTGNAKTKRLALLEQKFK